MAEPASQPIGTADIEVRANLEPFRRGLRGAEVEVQRLTTMAVRGFDTTSASTDTAAASQAQFNNQVRQGNIVFVDFNRSMLEGSRQAAALDNNLKNVNVTAMSGSRGFMDMKRGVEENAKSFITIAKEVSAFAGYLGLAIKVAQAGSPAFKGLMDRFTGGTPLIQKLVPATAQLGAGIASVGTTAVKTGGYIATLTPAAAGLGAAIAAIGPHASKTAAAVTSIGPAVVKVHDIMRPFQKISGAAEIIGLAKHFSAAGVAAYALSPAIRQVANKEVTDGLKAIGPALMTAAPAATYLGKEAATRVAPVLANIARFGGPLLVAGAALKAYFALVDLGAKKIEELNALAAGAGKAGTSVEFFQRHIEGAKELRVSVEAITSSMTRFNDISKSRLDGSQLENRLKEFTDAGNFKNNPGVKLFKDAVTASEKYEAILKLIDSAILKGERLAALRLAEEFFSPEIVQRMRASDGFAAELLQKAKEIEKTKLVKEEDVVRAEKIKQEYGDAAEILAEKWKPLQKDLTNLSLNMWENWNGTVLQIAQAVEWANKLYQGLKTFLAENPGVGQAVTRSATGVLRNLPAVGPAIRTLEYFGSTPKPATGYGAMPLSSNIEDRRTAADVKGVNAAVSEQDNLFKRLNITSTSLQASIDENERKWRKLGDTSKSLKKDTEEVKNAFDRAIASIQKQTAALEGEAKAVGASVGEHQRLRTESVLEDALLQAKLPKTEERIRQIEKLSKRAGEAADNLARLRLQDDLNFERSQLTRSDEEGAIAARLRAVYGNNYVQEMNGAYAAQMRFNEALRQTKEIANDLVGGGLKDLKSSLMEGANFFDALGKAGINALNKIADKLLDMAAKKLVDNAFGGSSSWSWLSGLFGGGGGGQTMGGASTGGLAAIYHKGGVAGGSAPLANIHSGYFNNAPKFARGLDAPRVPGINEVPVLAHKGEVIGWPDQMREAFGGQSIQVDMTDNRTISIGAGADPKVVEQLREELARDRIERKAMIIKTVREMPRLRQG